MRMRRLRMTSRAFEKVATIGKGAFGKVMLVRMRGTNQLFAMKKLRKGARFFACDEGRRRKTDSRLSQTRC